MRSLSELKSRLDQAKGAHQVLLQRSKDLAGMVEKNTIYRQSIEEAQAFLQGVAQDTQTKLKIHIQDIVQLALDACFPDEYEFTVDFEIKRGST